MKAKSKLSISSIVLSSMLLGGCATSSVSSSNRDTTGAYDGVWIGTVAEPRSSTQMLPGNWRMSCEWEPYEIYFVVDDGQMQLGRLEERTLVSTKGKFKFKVNSGKAGMVGGSLPGNGRFLQVFSGSLAGENPRGKYTQVITSIGGNGCSSKIHFRKQSESEA